MTSALPNALDEVQRLQAELLQAQRRLQAVADASGSLIGNFELSLHDDGTLALASVDTMAESLLGRTCTALIGHDFFSIFPSLSATPVPAGLRNLALVGGVLGPLSLLGEGYLSGKGFN
jgi:hypothetical protein